jgi:hypothetical protein
MYTHSILKQLLVELRLVSFWLPPSPHMAAWLQDERHAPSWALLADYSVHIGQRSVFGHGHCSQDLKRCRKGLNIPEYYRIFLENSENGFFPKMVETNGSEFLSA